MHRVRGCISALEGKAVMGNTPPKKHSKHRLSGIDPSTASTVRCNATLPETP